MVVPVERLLPGGNRLVAPSGRLEHRAKVVQNVSDEEWGVALPGPFHRFTSEMLGIGVPTVRRVDEGRRLSPSPLRVKVLRHR